MAKYEVSCTTGTGKVQKIVVEAPSDADARRMALAQTGLPKISGIRQLPS